MQCMVCSDNLYLLYVSVFGLVPSARRILGYLPLKICGNGFMTIVNSLRDYHSQLEFLLAKTRD